MPKSLPQTEKTLLIRTDFSDQAAWEALRTAATTPDEEDFVANVHVVDDPAYSDLTTEQIVALAPPGDSLVIVADKSALTAPGMPLLAVMLFDEEDEDAPEQGHDELRVAVEGLSAIENNISIGNMDWEEFVGAADAEGVFRGF
ncbi:hypothetical protein FNH09_17280 [Streptomyces adustus]|uniref:DUF6924 domain-containing protein n=1 Tax=Streptomyces adustus TaxID=1609272 RepID=A0A5N8VCH1_9ACTN|nr:hypothetical protein [Streptomyces adustus]MPY32951.1 hypothetical protein [Streptomyces adustus]